MEDLLCKDCKHCVAFKLIPFIGPTKYICTHPGLATTNKVTGKTKKNYNLCSDARNYLGFCSTIGYNWEKK